ncbi:MAG: TonB-dependent receptor, partial [Aquirufa sp.]
MLNVIIIAGALASVGVTSRESLVDSRQSSVGSSPEESSTIYHSPFSSSQYPVVSSQEKISTLYSPLSTLKKDSTLAEVTISAPKYPEKLARSGKVVSVISAEMIQANQGKSLGELLQQSVGVAVVGARSAPGTNQEIYVRGANTGHVLLLMDGFPLNDPSHISSVMDWNLISLA